jgi:omega-6 fatty acid desaturase (delta-12 desaturase)
MLTTQMMNTLTESRKTGKGLDRYNYEINRPVLRKSIWQICNSLIPYLFIWFLMYQSLQISYWITLALAVPASGFLIRMFIIFHDCGHGSFFKSKRANDILGNLLGILTFTPYDKWHLHHRIHHATSGNLDKRGVGDVDPYC